MHDEAIDIQGSSGTIWLRGGKRVFDVIASTALLVLLSPLLVVVALLVKVSSPGPVFFRQARGGLHGVNFRPFKFRTMRGDRKPDPKEIVPLTHSDITPLGRFLRRSKLDELPQLLNVVGGDMSLVGPRPTLPDQVEAYDAFRRQRLLVRPGITGLAQVYSSAQDTWEERILYDIAYVRRCGVALDVHIMLRTGVTVVLGERRTRREFDKTRFAQYVNPPRDYEGGRPSVVDA